MLMSALSRDRVLCLVVLIIMASSSRRRMRTWSRWRSSTSLWTASSTPAGDPCAPVPPTSVVGAQGGWECTFPHGEQELHSRALSGCLVGVWLRRRGQGLRLLSWFVLDVHCRADTSLGARLRIPSPWFGARVLCRCFQRSRSYHLAVTCSVLFAGEVQDYGPFWEMASWFISVFSASWLDSAACVASVYAAVEIPQVQFLVRHARCGA